MVKPKPDHVVDVVNYHGIHMARIKGHIIDWVCFGNLDALYRVNIYVKPWQDVACKALELP
jgi:hypothetical protein